jgi:hypothetical protein
MRGGRIAPSPTPRRPPTSSSASNATRPPGSPPRSTAAALGHELLLVLQKASRARLAERLARHLETARKPWNRHDVEPLVEEPPSPGNRCAHRSEPTGELALAAMPAR